MKILKTESEKNLEHNNKIEMDNIISRIVSIVKDCDTYDVNHKIRKLDTFLAKLKSENKKVNDMLVKSSELKFKIKNGMTDLTQENMVIKKKLIEILNEVKK